MIALLLLAALASAADFCKDKCAAAYDGRAVVCKTVHRKEEASCRLDADIERKTCEAKCPVAKSSDTVHGAGAKP